MAKNLVSLLDAVSYNHRKEKKKMIENITPHRVAYFSKKQLTDYMHPIKFNGPGWYYIQDRITTLIIPDTKENNPWKASWEDNQLFCVHLWEEDPQDFPTGLFGKDIPVRYDWEEI